MEKAPDSPTESAPDFSPAAAAERYRRQIVESAAREKRARENLRKAETRAKIILGATLVSGKTQGWSWSDRSPAQAARLLSRLARTLGPARVIETLEAWAAKHEAQAAEPEPGDEITPE